MDYTPEERAIIARMADASKRIRDIMAGRHTAHAATGTGMKLTAAALAEAVSALATTIEQSNELSALFHEYIDAHIEFLDTL